jgi:outer membrane protein OmpA-like peptidoglycan-associated protein
MRKLFVLLAVIVGCSPKPGPDKQFVGTLQGGATGAISGAVTGFQVGAGTGPGAALGLGVGAVAGGFRGMMQDRLEDELLLLQSDIREARSVAYAQKMLEEQSRRRAELHPGRDIFPSDLFFRGDEVQLSPEGKAILGEIYKLNKNRLPWSRFGVVSYVQSNDPNASYPNYLNRRRSRAIGDYLVSLGLEPRRITAQSVILDEPLIHGNRRYSQAIEFLPRDLPGAPGKKEIKEEEGIELTVENKQTNR